MRILHRQTHYNARLERWTRVFTAVCSRQEPHDAATVFQLAGFCSAMPLSAHSPTGQMCYEEPHCVTVCNPMSSIVHIRATQVAQRDV